MIIYKTRTTEAAQKRGVDTSTSWKIDRCMQFLKLQYVYSSMLLLKVLHIQYSKQHNTCSKHRDPTMHQVVNYKRVKSYRKLLNHQHWNKVPVSYNRWFEKFQPWGFDWEKFGVLNWWLIVYERLSLTTGGTCTWRFDGSHAHKTITVKLRHMYMWTSCFFLMSWLLSKYQLTSR